MNASHAKKYASTLLAVLATLSVIVIVMAQFVFNNDDPTAISGEPHYTAAELKKEAVSKFSWPIYWAGPRDSTSFEISEKAAGAARVSYLEPGVHDAETYELFYVTTFKDEASRLAYPRRVKPFNKVTETTPNGNTISYQTSEMTAELVLLKDGAIVGISFPTPQTVETLRSTADSLVPLG